MKKGASAESLSEQEFAKLRDWITERDWEKWDRQIEKDSKDGKLDFLVAEAINAKQNGKLRIRLQKGTFCSRLNKDSGAMSKVYLLGAGPGDPGLLTVKAKNILEKADVVVYDYLANKEFLKFCRKDAEIIYVGKKGGDHTLPQDKINELLIDKASKGKIVARLKGGDPYVFGRGAEEAEELIQAGLDFEVVPGVTSAVAAPAYAGIPLTHRRYASSVSFITGHEDPDKPESAHNWQALATGTSTLVFFMGVKNLEYISSNLIQAGMRSDMPASLIHWGTTCRQRTLVSTIAEIPEVARARGSGHHRFWWWGKW